MVRVNIINPKLLADQHLIAEYNEILMLVAYAKKHPARKGIPASYCLGKGHMKFFKDKLLYLKKRHEALKQEMGRRGFRPVKSINLNIMPSQLKHDWKPKMHDFKVIKARLVYKLKLRPDYYRYYGERKGKSFFIAMLNKKKPRITHHRRRPCCPSPSSSW